MPAVSAALLVDSDMLDRFGIVLRHLTVGLIDQAVRVRWLSSDQRAESLSLGPIQAMIHPRVTWPFRGRRLRQLVDALAAQPPTVVHAMSAGSYRLADAVAEEFDADLVLTVSSLADCTRLVETRPLHIGRCLASSRPLATVLESQSPAPVSPVECIRPGVQASERIACFAHPDRAVTVVCTASFERGSGVDRLIEATAALHRRGWPAMLFLLGRGSQESSLRRLSRERGVSPYVTFSPPLPDLTPVLTSADIFVRPAAESAFSVDVLQAMGAGLAVITAPNSAADHLLDGETAVVCEQPTAPALADALERTVSDRPRAQGIAAGAAEYVRTHHSMSAMADRTAAVYRQLALARSTFSIRE